MWCVSLGMLSLGLALFGATGERSGTPCMAIGRDSVTAADLAAFVPAFAALPGTAHVAWAPSPGVTRWIAPAEMVRLGRQLGLALNPGEGGGSGGGSVGGACIERTVEVIDPDLLLQAMRAAGAGFAIELIGFGPRQTPAGRLEFSVRALPRIPRISSSAHRSLEPAPPAGGLPPVLWRGRVVTDSGRAFPVWARVRVTISRPGLIAVQALEPGQTVSSDAIALVQLNDYPAWEAPLADPALAIGRRVRRRVAAGAPVLPELLAVRCDIERGDPVTVDLSGDLPGEAQATLTVQAESPGRTGENVLLKNPLTGRRFSSRVTGVGRAVMLPERATVRPNALKTSALKASVLKASVLNATVLKATKENPDARP